MLTQIEETKLNPEHLEIAQTYLQNLNISETAQALGIPEEEVRTTLNAKEVRKFIDNVFLEQGYMNRFKLARVLDKIIESKLEEAEETGMYTGKDLLEVLTLAHKIQMENIKASKEQAPTTQNNVQVNDYGNNLSNLLERIITGE